MGNRDAVQEKNIVSPSKSLVHPPPLHSALFLSVTTLLTL